MGSERVEALEKLWWEGQVDAVMSAVRADPTLLQETDAFDEPFGQWLLEMASSFSVLDVMRAALALGADVNYRRDGCDTTPLSVAVSAGSPEAVACLLQSGADPNDSGCESWPMHEAARRGDVEILELLCAAGADVNQQDDLLGARPLHKAAQSGQPEAVRWLAAHGAEVSAPAGELGARTPLLYAIEAGELECVEALLEAGADPRKKEPCLTAIKSHDGITPLEIAEHLWRHPEARERVRFCHPNARKRKGQYEAVYELLLNYKRKW